MKRIFLACVLALVSLPALADTVMSMVSSDATEWVGRGQSKTYTNANATFLVAGDRMRLTVRVAGTDGKTWDLRLKAPVNDEFRPYEYWFAEREGFETGRAPSMDFSGDGRACADVYGSFTIRQIGYDANGKVNMLEATVLQRCDSAEGPPLAVVLMYRAPQLNFSMKSEAIDTYVGLGQTVRLYGDTSIFSIGSPGPTEQIYVSGLGTSFFITLELPYGHERFQKGTYVTMSRATGNLGGMDFSMGSRGGGGYGKLEILSITYDSIYLKQISARYWFYADPARTRLLRSGNFNLVTQ